jgi:N-acetylmuramoyl-L-alanine amidase
MAKVILDAGHGGYDAGAMYNGRLEKTDNLDLTLAVGEILANNGVDVYHTRVQDVYVSPLQRAQMANEEGADLFVSIHRNSSPSPNTYNGVQTLIYNEGGIKEEAEELINMNLENLGFQNLGVDVRTDLAVLRRTDLPAMLIEVGFINTQADNTIFDQKFMDVANGIASGILDVLDLPYEELKPNYRVQVGLFRNYNNAQNLEYNLSQLGYDVLIIPQGEYYAVQVGALQTMEEAVELEQELRLTGYSTLIVKVQ